MTGKRVTYGQWLRRVVYEVTEQTDDGNYFGRWYVGSGEAQACGFFADELFRELGIESPERWRAVVEPNTRGVWHVYRGMVTTADFVLPKFHVRRVGIPKLPAGRYDVWIEYEPAETLVSNG